MQSFGRIKATATLFPTIFNHCILPQMSRHMKCATWLFMSLFRQAGSCQSCGKRLLRQRLWLLFALKLVVYAREVILPPSEGTPVKLESTAWKIYRTKYLV